MHRVRRAHALAALAVTALTLTTACTATNAQTTTVTYDPADGEDADLGRVHVDSLLVVSKAGTEGPGNVVARLTNAGSSDASITIAGPSGSGLDDTFEVGAEDAVSIGPDGDQTATITEVGAEPGGLVDLTLSDADGTRKTITVPVVTDTQPEFATLVPTPTPTPTPTPSPSERSATPSRSATSSSSIRPLSSSAPSSSSSD